jgi:hypothetical protein
MSSSRAARNLADGLDILDEIITERDGWSAIAKNVGDTYAQKILAHVSQRLTAGNDTEPQLEGLFRLLTELEAYEYGDKKELDTLKVEIFMALFESYFTGYSEEEKKREMLKLLNASDT